MFDIEENSTVKDGAVIKVIGIGGAGGNAVNTMINSSLQGVEFLVANTDMQALKSNLAPTILQIGQEATKGLGAGSNPEMGRRAAMEDYQKIAEYIQGADMVFVTAGMGGGTGTGAAPIIAKIAKELGALTVGVVTKPFIFEGKRRMRQAEAGVQCLREEVDSLITIPNQRLLYIAGEGLSMVETFKVADQVLLNAVRGISDLIMNTGLINCDFADVRTIMQNKGLALMGTGEAEGTSRAVEAATNAISSPLLEDISIDGATGIIINVTGSAGLTAFEVNEATTLIMEAADEDAEIIFGTVVDDAMEEKVKVTVIATGLGNEERQTQGKWNKQQELPPTQQTFTMEKNTSVTATPTARVETVTNVVTVQAEPITETIETTETIVTPTFPEVTSPSGFTGNSFPSSATISDTQNSDVELFTDVVVTQTEPELSETFVNQTSTAPTVQQELPIESVTAEYPQQSETMNTSENTTGNTPDNPSAAESFEQSFFSNEESALTAWEDEIRSVEKRESEQVTLSEQPAPVSETPDAETVTETQPPESVTSETRFKASVKRDLTETEIRGAQSLNELSRAKTIAEKLGILGGKNSKELDTPAFMRRRNNPADT